MMKRRKFLQQSMLASAGVMVAGRGLGRDGESVAGVDFPVVRVPEARRKFKSQAVEKIIREVRTSAGNKETGWLFENCFPNTLDTTVDFEMIGGKPDTYVITGDIDAMWLRDSSAQVWPYLSLCKDDKDLQRLVRGVIHRQAKCVLKDPYANAFYKDETKVSEWKKTDLTDMKPGIHERKWEIDSLCYPIRLAHGYYTVTGDLSPFDAEWLAAMQQIVKTFREQQRLTGEGPYTFQRQTAWATDGVPMGGYGYPTKKVGLIHSMFRPSDDATIYPFLIPSNIFAANSLLNLAGLLGAIRGAAGNGSGNAAGNGLGNAAGNGSGNKELEGQCIALEKQCLAFAGELWTALEKHAIVTHSVYGEVFAYEADGFGNHTFMDDANVPSLLALPYLQSPAYSGNLSVLHSGKRGYTVYRNTRRLLLGESNPFFFKGKAAEGIGGPHAGLDMIWPLSIIMRGLTSTDDKEIKFCLETLRQTHA